MQKTIFPEGFIWGAATASYQIEGATREDGRGESIWDRFSHTPGKVLNGDTGDVACDHYHRYKEDVKIMKEIGLKGYRFSVAWPRIFPEGKGKPNPKGLDFYKALVDELLNSGIEPIVTLYHWDLPQALQDRGGWANRDTIGYYTDYAACMFEALGDRVKKWITHNEPWVVAFVGNAMGEHAPGFKDYALAIQVSHNLLVSHAKAVEAYRDLTKDGKIGITLNLSPVYPAIDLDKDGEAVWIADGFLNRWFLDPVFKGVYPEDMLKLYREEFNSPDIKPGDMEILSEHPIDFIGINYYTRNVVTKVEDGGTLFGIDHVKPEGAAYTEMGWEIYPEGLYDLLMRVKKDYNDPCIYITENGAAFKDENLVDGIVVDDDRIDYLKKHFEQAHRAIQDGVKLEAYYVWSLMDNFEWAYGYSKRFGIIYVDYKTQKRIWKKSALWYKEVIGNNGF